MLKIYHSMFYILFSVISCTLIYTTPQYHHPNSLKDTGMSNLIKFTNTQPAFTDFTPKWQISHIFCEIAK